MKVSRLLAPSGRGGDSHNLAFTFSCMSVQYFHCKIHLDHPVII